MMDNETQAVFRQAFGCGAALAETIGSLAHAAAFARGQQLYPLPDRDETTLITAGQAQEVAYGRDGGTLVIQPLRVGEFYGSLLGHADDGKAGQVEATDHGAGAHFQTVTMLRLMESYSCIAVAITRQLAGRLAAMRQRMVDAVLLSTTGRICAELLRQAKGSADRTIRPLPVFSELAINVQSTRETVSRTISQLEKRGIVKRVDGGLQLVAPHRLEELIY